MAQFDETPEAPEGGDEEVQVRIGSIYGLETNRGLVVLKIGEQETQFLPHKARLISAWLNEAAAAAEGDEVFVRWLVDVMQLEEQQAALALGTLRDVREKIARDQGDD